MKNRNARLLCIIAILFSIVLNSCNDDEEIIQTTDLIITISNETGNAISNASVVLYANKEDWNSTENAIHSQFTNTSGIVTFPALKEQSYFIDVTSSNLTNWSGTIESGLLILNKINPLNVALNKSNINFLVGKKERSYQLTDLSVNGISLYADVDLCEKDNVLFLQRENNLGVENSGVQKCQESEHSERLFTWEFSSNESKLVLRYEDGDELEYNVVSMDGTKMIFQTNIPFEGKLILVEVEFLKL